MNLRLPKNVQEVIVKATIPADIYQLKVHNRNASTRGETCPKLTIKTPERPQWRRSGVFIVSFGHITAGWDSDMSCDTLYNTQINSRIMAFKVHKSHAKEFQIVTFSRNMAILKIIGLYHLQNLKEIKNYKRFKVIFSPPQKQAKTQTTF